MEVIINKIEHSLELENYIKGNSCFLDIETTGLSRNRNMIYLIGILFFNKKDNKWILKQYFANSIDQELNLLNTFIDDISLFDNIINYNGDSFDLPFINHRLKLLGSNKSIDMDKSFDLYRIIRQNKIFLDLENLKLKTIEEYLGFYREDLYTGFQCISFYKNYIKSKDANLKSKVLKHNHDDLVYMLDVITILDVLNSKKSINIKNSDETHRFIIDNLSLEKNLLKFNGSIEPYIPFDIKIYQMNYNIITTNRNHFDFQLNISRGFIEEGIIASYIDLHQFDFLDISCSYSKLYSIPSNIFLISVDSNLILNNIKLLFSNLIKI